MSDQDPPAPTTPLSLPESCYTDQVGGIHIPRAIAHSDIAITRHRRLNKTKLCRYGEHCTYRPLGRCFYAHTEEELKERPPKTEEEIAAEQMEAVQNITMQDQAAMWGMWPSPPPLQFGYPLAFNPYYGNPMSAYWAFAMQAAAVAEAARAATPADPAPMVATDFNTYNGLDYQSWVALKYAQDATSGSNRDKHLDIPTASASAAGSMTAEHFSDHSGSIPHGTSEAGTNAQDDPLETQSDHCGADARADPGTFFGEKARSR